MRLFKLGLLAAGAAYAYKRFVADAGAGRAETEAAEPFSSDSLDDGPQADAQPAPVAAGDGEAAPEAAERPDTLERPTWLDPSDAS